MRFVDIIARQGVSGYGDDFSRSRTLEFRDRILDLASIDISNVSEYVEHQLDIGGDEAITAADMPNLRLPFEACWMELQHDGVRAGFYMTTDDDQRQIESLVFFQRPSKDALPILFGNVIADIDERGELIEESVHGVGSQASMADVAAGIVVRAYMAIAFMNCKNVVLEDAPDTRTRQQRRYDERKGTKPVQFKTLVIEPMKQVLKTEGGIEHHGLKKALHICRGHFATYSEDRPLFGKYSGTFWKPAHVRGSADVGMVGKDYKVKAPKGTTV